MTLIDSHCHLNYPGLVEREDEVLTSARARGVSGFLNISTRQREWAEVVAATERHPDVWASIGVHPHEADAHPDLGTAALVEAADHPRVVAIGECGLDYYYDKSDRDSQKAIVLGKGGARLKAIGQAAREAITEHLSRKVHLFLHVKVNPRWDEDRSLYRDIGLEWAE